MTLFVISRQPDFNLFPFMAAEIFFAISRFCFGDICAHRFRAASLSSSFDSFDRACRVAHGLHRKGSEPRCSRFLRVYACRLAGALQSTHERHLPHVLLMRPLLVAFIGPDVQPGI
jgi:hypothetical protein